MDDVETFRKYTLVMVSRGVSPASQGQQTFFLSRSIWMVRTTIRLLYDKLVVETLVLGGRSYRLVPPVVASLVLRMAMPSFCVR
jgi:hypothetical protein